MGSNHELDKFLKSHNLLILQSCRSRQSPQKQVPDTKLVQDSARRPVPLLTPPARSVYGFASAFLNIFDIMPRTREAGTTAFTMRSRRPGIIEANAIVQS